MGITYDTGALIAADRAERRIWARHRALLTLRHVPTVPVPVVAQSWRGGSRQALLARLLAGCDVEGAIRRHDLVVSPDPEDLQAIAAAVNRRLEIDRP
jgi:hypothetical protein